MDDPGAVGGGCTTAIALVVLTLHTNTFQSRRSIVRRAYAKQVLATAGVKEPRLESAFAHVSWEHFIGANRPDLPRPNFRNNIVTTMKSLPITLRRIGNSLGIVIPKPVLAQVGLSEQVELTVERGAIILRKPRKTARSGWSEAAHSITIQGEDKLLMGEFANAADVELEW